MEFPKFYSVDFRKEYTLTDNDFYRFQKYLSTPNSGTGCVLWTGSRDSWGYGCFGIGEGRPKVIVKASRLAWVFSGNELVREKPQILHKCDNPACCNPKHLWAGTNDDNHRDKAKKRRGRKGHLGLPLWNHDSPFWVVQSKDLEEQAIRKPGRFYIT